MQRKVLSPSTSQNPHREPLLKPPAFLCLPLPSKAGITPSLWSAGGTTQGQGGLTVSPQCSQEEPLTGSHPTLNKSHCTQGLPGLAQGCFLKNLSLQRALTTGWQSNNPNPSSYIRCQGRRAGTCPLQFSIKPGSGTPHPLPPKPLLRATAQNHREQTNHAPPVDPKPPKARDPTKNFWFSTYRTSEMKHPPRPQGVLCRIPWT